MGIAGADQAKGRLPGDSHHEEWFIRECRSRNCNEPQAGAVIEELVGSLRDSIIRDIMHAVMKPLSATAQLARTVTPGLRHDITRSNNYSRSVLFLIRWEIPRLCRGGSKSLTFSGVCFTPLLGGVNP